MGRACWLALFIVQCACAQPAPDQLMDAPVLREASDYQFSTLELDSADGARHYRVWLGRPLKVSAANPVAYLLDGNAAMAALDTKLLNHLSHRPAPPVLVAVGYATPLRIERNARTFDYTPRVGEGAQRDPLTNVPSGGADQFLDLLTEQIRPLVNQRLEIQPRRQLLWGHSYGGLLVLHALTTRPQAFDDYAAASPSLWWNNGVIHTDGLAQRLHAKRPTLLLMRGDAEPASPTRAAKPQDDGAVKRLLASLQSVEGLTVRYQAFPGLGHGPMLAASLRYTLEQMSQ
ncbi:alpha/beta hydrolase-fold protein [Pseudomonas sp. 13B_2.1_Bac1]|uniref:alpha/beta hydrolase n=1 Tax=Pseudomonas sp. 13B_2.1_Bac1 TaxID=2971624 RepID=UPI0021C7EB3B|nr:alpha/beta hydrolase-fold protein [Pseudomonas sp. 13B_2.1_Bac1]MCU1782982.1 alpha/beta hydrolase-fold protein [Pseudomonas sp. 13B_2.1_Bac1]